MLSIVLLGVIILSVIMLSFAILGVIMMSVVAPFAKRQWRKSFMTLPTGTNIINFLRP